MEKSRISPSQFLSWTRDAEFDLSANSQEKLMRLRNTNFEYAQSVSYHGRSFRAIWELEKIDGGFSLIEFGLVEKNPQIAFNNGK